MTDLPGSGNEERSGEVLRGSPWALSDAVSQMRDYHDGPALDRVWNRLEMRRRRSVTSGAASRSLGAVALVAAGIVVGVVFERNRAEHIEPAAVASEVIDAPLPAASLGDRSRPSPHHASSDDATTPRRNRARLRSVPSVPRVDGALPVAIDGESMAPGEVLEIPSAPSAPVGEVPSKPAWLGAAEQGDFAAAYSLLDQSGGFDVAVENGTPEELMNLVEVARFVGRTGRAIQALRVVTTRYESDPNAPIAAMILGNLLSRSGDAAGAADAYALNRRLSPGGDFAEDALIREFDMALSDGDLASVERLRAQYEAEFPDGRYLEELQAEAERLAARLRGTNDKSGDGERDSGRSDSGKSESGKSDSGKSESGKVDGSKVVASDKHVDAPRTLDPSGESGEPDAPRPPVP